MGWYAAFKQHFMFFEKTAVTVVLTATFQERMSKAVPECQSILDFAAAGDDAGGCGDN